MVVIIGPSGSGKSTLLRCINRLEKISSGELYVNGTALHDKKIDINRFRREIGIVFQHFNLYPHKTVIDNIVLAPVKVLGLSKEEAAERATSYLSRVGIADKASSYPSQLSGDSSSGSQSPGAWPCIRRSCCSTSPHRLSIPK